jgi:hypothetical protein
MRDKLTSFDRKQLPLWELKLQLNNTKQFPILRSGRSKPMIIEQTIVKIYFLLQNLSVANVEFCSTLNDWEGTPELQNLTYE